jgi:hypothetical protein
MSPLQLAPLTMLPAAGHVPTLLQAALIASARNAPNVTAITALMTFLR